MKFSATSLLTLLLKIPFSFSNVPDALERDGRFTTLLGALNRAGLMTELARDGPFTILAPTDDAFGKLPDGLLTCLLEENKGLLADILKYHVVTRKITDLCNIDFRESLKTLHGDNVTGLDLNQASNCETIAVGNSVIQTAYSILVPPTVATNTDFAETCKDVDICNSVKNDLNLTNWNEPIDGDFAFGTTCSCQTVKQYFPIGYGALSLDKKIQVSITCEDAEELCYGQACFLRSGERTLWDVARCVDYNKKSFDSEKVCMIFESFNLDMRKITVSIDGEVCNNFTSTIEYDTDIAHIFVDCSNLGYDDFSAYYDGQDEVLNRTTNEGPISHFFSFAVSKNAKLTAASSGSNKFYAITNSIIGIIIGMVLMY